MMEQRTRQVLHSSHKNDWQTPRKLFNDLDRQYSFTLDLCASKENALCQKYSDDCFQVQYEKEVFFCNPPYGKQVGQILDSIPATARGIILLPSRTGTAWFHELNKKASWMLFYRGRIRFEGAPYSAPFDSVLVGMNLESPCYIRGLLCAQARQIGGQESCN